MFAPHTLRGFFGILINFKMPRSHHIIQELNIGEEEKGHLKFDHVQKCIKQSAKK